MPKKHILSLSLSVLVSFLCVFVAVCSLLFICYFRNHRPLSPTLPQSAVLRPQGNDVHMAHDTEERRGGSARLYMAQWDPPRVDVIDVGVCEIIACEA